ncbi:Uncharacterized protein FKW44_014071, partial [Caligus rogercresseyi]
PSHMGNVKYRAKVISNLDATEIPEHINVERVATILGVNNRHSSMPSPKTILPKGNWCMLESTKQL